MSFGNIDRETAQDMLERVIAAAVSPTVAARHRRNLGVAASWLQHLIDCGVIPDGGKPTAGAPGEPTAAGRTSRTVLPNSEPCSDRGIL